jgi:hypothetical protein
LDNILEVYIAKADSAGSEAYANLFLPAAPYVLFDALDKARVQQGDEMYFQVEEYYAFEFMEPFIADCDNLVELNALCRKLSELDEMQGAAFEGLLKMEIAKKDGPITVGKLIDLAYSADCCHVVDEALNDSQLGRFYAENGFVPEVDNLSDRLFDMLDFERIGREQRQGEGGVFTERGYVVHHSELTEVYKDMSFHIRTPDYQILLELPDGSHLELPAKELPNAPSHYCVDCRVPSLMAAIDAADLDEVNEFAMLLKSMGDALVRKYKAVLCATGCETLEDAATLAGYLDEYTFDEDISSLRELGLDELEFSMGKENADLLAKYTDLYSYGRALLERDQSAITGYGLVARPDHQPLQNLSEQQAQQHMMT